MKIRTQNVKNKYHVYKENRQFIDRAGEEIHTNLIFRRVPESCRDLHTFCGFNENKGKSDGRSFFPQR